MLNAATLDFSEYSYANLVKIFVHELAHALFFLPFHFKNFPEINGEPFLFTDSNQVLKMRGAAVLGQIRSHFNCPTIDGGGCSEPTVCSNRQLRLRTTDKSGRRTRTSKRGCSGPN